jgi:DDE superfamily endonuclease
MNRQGATDDGICGRGRPRADHVVSGAAGRLRCKIARNFGRDFTRKLARAVGIPRHHKVYPIDVRLIWPRAVRGRPRKRYVPDVLSIPAEKMLSDVSWRTISWRTGTKVCGNRRIAIDRGR